MHRDREEKPMNSTKFAEWDELVRECGFSKIYHLYQWGMLLEEVHGYRLVYLQEDTGVFPLAYVKSLIFGNRLISLPFADYGGPCAQDEETAEKLISECEEKAEELNVDFIEIRCPNNQYFDILTQRGFVKRDEYLTFVLPLNRRIEELWKGIGDKKRNVKKAERSGVQIVEATNKTDLKAFYLLYLATMKRLGSPPQSYRFFEKMCDSFYPRNIIIPLAIHEGKYIAGGAFFVYNGTIHYAYGCSLKDYLPLRPNDLIQWYMIKRGNEQGYSSLDFGRTREGDGTVLFKRRWGGEVVSMPYFYKFYRGTINKRPEIQYRSVSRLWSKYVPKLIANGFGPWIIKQVG